MRQVEVDRLVYIPVDLKERNVAEIGRRDFDHFRTIFG
jgi:hypothetical protein